MVDYQMGSVLIVFGLYLVCPDLLANRVSVCTNWNVISSAFTQMVLHSGIASPTVSVISSEAKQSHQRSVRNDN